VKPGVHILRHTFCSHLAMKGAPARAIQEFAGHQDLTTTQRYMHLTPAALEAPTTDRAKRGMVLCAFQGVMIAGNQCFLLCATPRFQLTFAPQSSTERLTLLDVDQ